MHGSAVGREVRVLNFGLLGEESGFCGGVFGVFCDLEPVLVVEVGGQRGGCCSEVIEMQRFLRRLEPK